MDGGDGPAPAGAPGVYGAPSTGVKDGGTASQGLWVSFPRRPFGRGAKVLRPRSLGPSPKGTPRETDPLPRLALRWVTAYAMVHDLPDRAAEGDPRVRPRVPAGAGHRADPSRDLRPLRLLLLRHRVQASEAAAGQGLPAPGLEPEARHRADPRHPWRSWRRPARQRSRSAVLRSHRRRTADRGGDRQRTGHRPRAPPVVARRLSVRPPS